MLAVALKRSVLMREVVVAEFVPEVVTWNRR